MCSDTQHPPLSNEAVTGKYLVIGKGVEPFMGEKSSEFFFFTHPVKLVEITCISIQLCVHEVNMHILRSILKPQAQVKKETTVQNFIHGYWLIASCRKFCNFIS